MGTGSFPGLNYGWGVLLATLLVPWSWKSRVIPLPNLWGTIRPVTGTLYLLISNFYISYPNVNEISYFNPLALELDI